MNSRLHCVTFRSVAHIIHSYFLFNLKRLFNVPPVLTEAFCDWCQMNNPKRQCCSHNRLTTVKPEPLGHFHLISESRGSRQLKAAAASFGSPVNQTLSLHKIWILLFFFNLSNVPSLFQLLVMNEWNSNAFLLLLTRCRCFPPQVFPCFLELWTWLLPWVVLFVKEQFHIRCL